MPKLNGLIIAMVTVGLMKMLGIAFESILLRSVANTFASSPAPSPFYRFRDDTRIRCIFSDAKEATIPWDSKTRNSIEGPHRRNVTFLHMFALARRSDIGTAGKARVDSMIDFHFCTVGSWGAQLCGEIPAIVKIESQMTDSMTSKEFTYTCRR